VKPDPAYYFCQRASAPALAMARLLFTPSFLARACPPMRPRATAALLFPSSVSSFSASPVAIFITWTALETTSAGRLWPFGVRGMLSGKDNTPWLKAIRSRVLNKS
jgi:hypothetical protein